MKKQLLFIPFVFACIFFLSQNAQAQTLKTATGGPNAFILSLGQNLGTTYPAGLSFTFISNQTISAGGTTLNVNGTGIKSLVKNVNQPLVANDILAGQAVQVLYDGTNFQVLNVVGNGSGSSVPVGTVSPYAGSTLPTGWLFCDGTTVSRTVYSELFNIIGTAHGAGDGSTTFNLPDYRGRFLRGVTGGSTNDPDAALRTAMNTGGNTGNNLGSVQSDDNKSHTHTAPVWNVHSGSNAQIGTAQGSNLGNMTTNASGGNEARPKNAYVNYIICFSSSATGTITGGFGTSTGLSNALISLNGLTSSSQNFSTSSTGTSVNIVSSGNTHNFNIPLASIVGGNNITVTGSFPLFTVSGLASTATSQWVSTTGGIYYSSGKVGIGTATPYSNLELSSSVVGDNTLGILNTNSISGNVGIELRSYAGGGALQYIDFSSNSTSQASPDFVNRISSSGNGLNLQTQTATGLFMQNSNAFIGIGTSSPIATLDVNGNTRLAGTVTISSFTGASTRSLGVNSIGQLVTISGSNNLWIDYGLGGIAYTIAGTDLKIAPGYLTYFNTNSTANVGSLLSIQGTAGQYAYSQISLQNDHIRNSTTPLAWDFQHNIDHSFRIVENNNSVYYDRVTISNGNMMLGTPFFGVNLNVNGNARFAGPMTISSFAGTGTQALGVNNAGQLVTISGATSTSQWVSTTGGIYFNGGDVTHYGKIIGISSANPHVFLDNPSVAIGAATEIAINSNAGGTSKYFTMGVNNGGRNFYIFPQGGGSDALNIDFSGNVGIGVASGSAIGTKLNVNGSARFAGPMTISSFAGAGIQALGVNNLGQLVTIAGATPTTATGFSVYSSVNLTLATGVTPTIINFDIKNYDKATAFNLSTDKYVVPIAGEYLFTAKALTNNIGEVDISIFVNNILVEEVRTSPDPSTGLYNTAAITALLNLAANDSVDVRISQTTGSPQTLYSNLGTTIKFSGKRVGD